MLTLSRQEILDLLNCVDQGKKVILIGTTRRLEITSCFQDYCLETTRQPFGLCRGISRRPHAISCIREELETGDYIEVQCK